MNEIPKIFSKVDIDKRVYILRAALFIEDQISAFLAMLLGISDYRNGKSLSGSGSISFNQKINLLIDISALDDQTRKLFQKFMEIRNVFVHDIKAVNYEKCVSKIDGCQSWLLKSYPQPEGSLEERLENAVKHMCIEVLGKTLSITKPIHDKLLEKVKAEQYMQLLAHILDSMSEIRIHFNEHSREYLLRGEEIREERFSTLGDHISSMFYDAMTKKSATQFSSDQLEQILAEFSKANEGK